MKTVYQAETVLAAHLVAGLLREEGIDVVIEGEALQGAKGEIPLDLSTSPSVRVLRDEDADRAVAMIAERKEAVARPLRPLQEWMDSGKRPPEEWTVAWCRSADVSFPLVASVGGQMWQLRINNFPDEHLWTLFIDGQEFYDLDDFPNRWTYPEK